jgi:transcriptional regulator with XRE-family HTH domain
MVKVSDLKSASQIAEEARADPEVRRELERTALANAVAIRVISYRTEHGLSQTQLARRLGMHQSAIARIETGDHEPSLATLGKLAKGLEIDLHIDITHDGRVELRSDQSPRSVAEDAFRVDIAYLQANMQLMGRSLEATERLLTRFQSVRASEPGDQTGREVFEHLYARLTDRRAREREDWQIIEDLRRLVRDAEFNGIPAREDARG